MTRPPTDIERARAAADGVHRGFFRDVRQAARVLKVDVVLVRLALDALRERSAA